VSSGIGLLVPHIGHTKIFSSSLFLSIQIPPHEQKIDKVWNFKSIRIYMFNM